jgi:hypothetical protein
MVLNVRSCGKHDIQKMDVERQVFPNPDIPGEIPELFSRMSGSAH